MPNTAAKKSKNVRIDPPLVRRGVHELGLYIKRATAGVRGLGENNPELAKRLLLEFCRQVDSRKDVDPRLLTYLSNAFRQMLDAGDSDPRKALGLQRVKRGNPPDARKTRVLSWRDKEQIVDEATDMLESGKTQSEIMRALASAHRTSPDTIRGIVRAIRRGDN